MDKIYIVDKNVTHTETDETFVYYESEGGASYLVKEDAVPKNTTRITRRPNIRNVSLYEHYKGNLYLVLNDEVYDEVSNEVYAYYKDFNTGKSFVRPRSLFTQWLPYDPLEKKNRRRFIRFTLGLNKENVNSVFKSLVNIYAIVYMRNLPNHLEEDAMTSLLGIPRFEYQELVVTFPSKALEDLNIILNERSSASLLKQFNEYTVAQDYDSAAYTQLKFILNEITEKVAEFLDSKEGDVLVV